MRDKPSRCLSWTHALSQARLGDWPADTEVGAWESIFDSLFAGQAPQLAQARGRFRLFFADLLLQVPIPDGLNYPQRYLDFAHGRSPIRPSSQTSHSASTEPAGNATETPRAAGQEDGRTPTAGAETPAGESTISPTEEAEDAEDTARVAEVVSNIPGPPAPTVPHRDDPDHAQRGWWKCQLCQQHRNTKASVKCMTCGEENPWLTF